MKRVLFVFLCLASALSLSAEQATWVKLRLVDDREQAFIVPGTMTIRWSADSLFLSSPLVEVSYLRSDVKGYSFDTQDLTGDEITLPEASSGSTIVWESADRVAIYGVPDNATAEVYSTNALRQPVEVSHSADALHLDLSSLPHGIFIVKVSGLPSFKIKR